MRDGVAHFQRRGFSPPLASGHPIVMVYRLESTKVLSHLRQQIGQDADAFEARGNRVWGIQIDFDAATQKLGPYGEFLQEVRTALPTHYRLSITGLLDWASQGRLEDLNAWQGLVDEVVFQLYQGRHPIKGYRRYLERLSVRPLSLPFRIGLVERGDYDPEILSVIRRHPAYRGTVIFLLRPPSRPKTTPES